jgi:hypothetical protein
VYPLLPPLVLQNVVSFDLLRPWPPAGLRRPSPATCFRSPPTVSNDCERCALQAHPLPPGAAYLRRAALPSAVSRVLFVEVDIAVPIFDYSRDKGEKCLKLTG